MLESTLGRSRNDVVLEWKLHTSGESRRHLVWNCQEGLVSAPAGNDLKTIVYGVNHETLTSER